jgi:hypothetical protein
MDAAEHPDAVVVAGTLVDLGGQRVELAVKVRDQAQRYVEALARLGPEL